MFGWPLFSKASNVTHIHVRIIKYSPEYVVLLDYKTYKHSKKATRFPNYINSFPIVNCVKNFSRVYFPAVGLRRVVLAFLASINWPQVEQFKHGA